jgi:hypothetical protein
MHSTTTAEGLRASGMSGFHHPTEILRLALAKDRNEAERVKWPVTRTSASWSKPADLSEVTKRQTLITDARSPLCPPSQDGPRRVTAECDQQARVSTEAGMSRPPIYVARRAGYSLALTVPGRNGHTKDEARLPDARLRTTNDARNLLSHALAKHPRADHRLRARVYDGPRAAQNGSLAAVRKATGRPEETSAWWR